MNKKELIKIIIKVLIYALTLIGAYFGISSLQSCSTSQNVTHRGTGVIHYVDTIMTNGSTTLKY